MRTARRCFVFGIVLSFLTVSTYTVAYSQAPATAPNEWTWVGGTQNTANGPGQPGVYGTLGTPAPGNIPGGRDSAATWTDNDGKLWLLGGAGLDANAVGGILNDLWELDPDTLQWTWMGGSSTVPSSCAGSATLPCGYPGIFGTQGIPSAKNLPGGRNAASYWTDSNGDFWLFGGAGFDANGSFGELNDLWEFSPTSKEWTWKSGSNSISSNGGQSGVYGKLGIPSTANSPGGRDNATTWIDKSGNLWLFGGEGFDAQGNPGHMNDLWEFSPSAGNWTWIAGSSTMPSLCAANSVFGLCGWPADYGMFGIPAPNINPGSRVSAVGWTDSEGNLLLFGGTGSVFWESRDFSPIDQYDLWKFNPTTTQWAWISGNSTSICGESSSDAACGETGIYGTEGVPSIGNIPASRENAISWTDSTGNLWLFGGIQATTTSSTGSAFCNDVWAFEPTANEWAWMSGTPPTFPFFDTCGFTPADFGVQGTPAPTNMPSGRLAPAGWTDKSGNFWIFGGYGWPSAGAGVANLSDLWVYKPIAPAPEPSFDILASPNPVSIAAFGPNVPAIATGTTTVNLVATDGFNSPVTFTAAPTTMGGITAITGSFSPATLTGPGSTALTISVTGSVVQVPEPVPLTITATSGGVSQSIEVIVDVAKTGQITPPVFSVPAGTYSTPQTVTLSDRYLTNYGDAYMYYTTDGTTPTVSSPVYVNPITISSTTTLKAVAFDVIHDLSDVSIATFTILPPAATPAFSPGGGTYSSTQSVTITDSTTGAIIYFTTDGTTPTASSTVYSSPITVPSSETLQAVANANGYSLSPVASAGYTIGQPGFSITGTPITVAPGASSGITSTIALTPTGGFTGTVSFSCKISPIAASDPATCTIQNSVNITGSAAQTVTLTVNSTAATSALNHPGNSFWPRAGGTALAGMLFICLSARRRNMCSILGITVLLLFVAVSAIGCGGGGSNGGGGGGGGGNPGTTPGSYLITITGTSGIITEQGTVNLIIQ